MENPSGVTHDKENGHLAVKSSPEPGRDAATQTPQMPRHISPSRRQAAKVSSPDSSSSDESLAYEDTIPYQPSARKVEMTRGLPIPQVIVVEHGSDTLPLTEDAFSGSSVDERSGITNLAFEGKDEMVRSSSTGNFQQQANADGSIFLQMNDHQFFANDPSDPRILSVANVDRRLYFSLPKSARKKQAAKEFEIRSQPPTPVMKRSKEAAVSTDDSNFWIIPREHSSNSLNTTSTPVSKFAATDSVAGLYTISGRSTVVSNGFSEPVVGLYEMRLVSSMETQPQSMPRSVRKFEFTKMPVDVDRKRKRLQCCTDSFSMLFLILGLIIALITPPLVIPLFYVGPKLFIPYILVFLASGTLSALILTFSGIIGNVVWHYNENTKKLRPRLHCGRGPIFHFWGNGLYNAGEEKNQKELIV